MKINIFYLKFNFIIRIFNILFKGLPYLFKERYIINNIILISLIYTILNIFYIIISLIIIFKINFILINYNLNIQEYVWIYSNLISVFLSIIYIDLIYYNNVELKDNKINFNK